MMPAFHSFWPLRNMGPIGGEEMVVLLEGSPENYAAKHLKDDL